MTAEHIRIIASTTEEIDDARRWVGEMARGAGLDEESVSDLEVALTEVLANSIAHAYRGDPGHDIRLECRSAETGFELVVRDWGEPFDPDRYRPPALDDPQEGGYGVYLIDALMDSVQRERPAGGGNLLTMVKRNKEPT